jgi:ATP-binding cassette, subfamily F, member 3
MLQLTDISLQRGSRALFSGLSCTVHPGQRMGVVGRNGVGKSTLFELILGRFRPDSGELRLPGDWRIAHMAQQVQATERSALDFVMDGHQALRRLEADLRDAEAADDVDRLARLHAAFADLDGYAAPALAAEILHGLGFANDALAQPYATFSGGWRIRLNLAQALMTPADLLLLDEPTNHLDLDALLWLERWLKRFPGTLLVIAHDREFLDAVATGILHLHDGRADEYRGTFSSFERQRAEALAHQQAALTRQQQERRRIQAFVDRFRAKASKARQVQSRLKALERMENLAPLHAESPYNCRFATPARMSSPLVTFDRVDIGYGSTRVVRGINRSILPGARIGVLGPNGAGKTTLLKSLVGELPPLAGEIIRGANAAVGYFAQHQLEILDPALSPFRALGIARPKAREQWCRDYLGRWGFPGELADRPAGILSGGEKARLVLALIALGEPALLVLDEPTNHLDLDMREALSLALQDFGGALVLVSHDRSLLTRTVDELWYVHDGTVSTFDGDLEAYAATRLGPAAREPVHPRRLERQRAARQRELERPHRERIRSLEQDMERLARALADVEKRLADPEIYHDLPPDELDTLLAEAGRLRRRLEASEEAWLEAQEALERPAARG